MFEALVVLRFWFSRGHCLVGLSLVESVAIKTLCSLVRSGAQCTMASTPTLERIRLTISVTPEVHAAFVRLSKASSIPIGRAMGEWLGDTLDAVQFTASKVEEARAAPRLVMQEMHAYAMGLADETGAVLKGLRAGKKGAVASSEKGRSPSIDASAPISAALPPRPVIRGGKYTRKGHGQ